MGAAIETADGHAPLVVEGGRELSGIRYELPVASAQVKSAVLLAGLFASGETTVVEPIPTRDHTEILLAAAGARVRRRAHKVTVGPVERLELGRVEVPGDFSSAAPFIVAATLLPGSELIVHDVGLNPTRTGLLDVLARMGARITVINRRRVGGEPVGDLEVQSAELVATKIEPDGGAEADRRAAAHLARRRLRARGDRHPRRRRAACQGNRSNRKCRELRSEPLARAFRRAMMSSG